MSLVCTIGRSKAGARDASPGLISFIFMQFSGKTSPYNRLAPLLWELTPLRLGNLGSTTAVQTYKQWWEIFMSVCDGKLYCRLCDEGFHKGSWRDGNQSIRSERQKRKCSWSQVLNFEFHMTQENFSLCQFLSRLLAWRYWFGSKSYTDFLE